MSLNFKFLAAKFWDVREFQRIFSNNTTQNTNHIDFEGI